MSAANKTTIASSNTMKITVDFDEIKSQKKKCNSIRLMPDGEAGSRGFKMQQQFADIYKKTTYTKQRQSTLW